MNIGDMIEHLRRVADDLPDGMESAVRIHICNGPDEPAVSTLRFAVEPERRMNSATTEVLSANAVIDLHPHSDPERQELHGMTANVDDELARLVEQEAGEGPLEIPPGTKALNVGGIRIPLTDGGVPMVPGSPAAIAEGCICDPVKNNDGRGVEPGDSDNVHFIFKTSCPVHRPAGGGISVKG